MTTYGPPTLILSALHRNKSHNILILLLLAKKRQKKQQKDHDKPKSDRSEVAKDDLRDSVPSNRAGNNKSGGSNRGGTNAINNSMNDRGATGSNTGGKKAGGNSGAQGKKGNKGKKRSENTAGADKSKHDKDMNNQKDDSDEIDLSTIEIDPDEPTYCLCDQVKTFLKRA